MIHPSDRRTDGRKGDSIYALYHMLSRRCENFRFRWATRGVLCTVETREPAKSDKLQQTEVTSNWCKLSSLC